VVPPGHANCRDSHHQLRTSAPDMAAAKRTGQTQPPPPLPVAHELRDALAINLGTPRLEQKLTQQQLADLSRVSRSYISCILDALLHVGNVLRSGSHRTANALSTMMRHGLGCPLVGPGKRRTNTMKWVRLTISGCRPAVPTRRRSSENATKRRSPQLQRFNLRAAASSA
jgi:hypothetical protein